MKKLFVSLAALVCISSSACAKKTEAPSTSGTTTAAASAPSAEASGQDDSYALTTTSADCAVGATCTVSLRVEARGDYHLNAEYPYKFTAGDVAAIEFLGTDGGGKNIFTKAAGDFKKESEKVGVMTVKFKPSKAGDVTIAGVYKLSVCSDATCKLDNPSAKVTLAVR